MAFDNTRSQLQLEVIWKDSDMIELSVKATNGRYFGSTNVYDTSESLRELATSLGRLLDEKQPLIYEAGGKNDYAFCGMKFLLLDPTGVISVEINLEANCITQYSRPEKKDKVKLEILVYIAAIDRFRDELMALALNEEGVASLYGENQNS
ncbi:hypothetical protein LZD49_35280 [Dyadobacter sp. CY261]|uniref:hypothetical protein n=1 Tax=Dyadobacter sp. CY261 TaxID=2907203 RepID=UPI001F42301D|nr:hypothetical protein [Dyadobacter sp. CY261]MCF0075786.1 hypothetical protein [Dyadobacter sp. CY261]